MAIQVRQLKTAEEEEIRKRVRSRTEPARRVERARILWWSRQGKEVPTIAAEMGICPETVRLWIKRFNAWGLAGLEDRPRRGRPATYIPEQVRELMDTALTDPQTLGLPFANWTLDRLETYLQEEKGMGMKRSRINEILRAEGVCWRRRKT